MTRAVRFESATSLDKYRLTGMMASGVTVGLMVTGITNGGVSDHVFKFPLVMVTDPGVPAGGVRESVLVPFR